MNQWIEGIPNTDAVLAHEADHPRPDGIRLGHISVTRWKEGAPNNTVHDYIECDDRSYGEWICDHYQSRLQPYLSIIRLKTVNGEVFYELGFTGWCPLTDCKWAKDCRYFPVGQNGLPTDYKVKDGAK